MSRGGGGGGGGGLCLGWSMVFSIINAMTIN